MATRNWTASYQELLTLTELPTLERRRLELKLCHLFKIVQNLCFFPHGLVTTREYSPYNTRTPSHSLILNQTFAHTNSLYYSFIPHTVSRWNSLPEEVVSVPSLSSTCKIT